MPAIFLHREAHQVRKHVLSVAHDIHHWVPVRFTCLLQVRSRAAEAAGPSGGLVPRRVNPGRPRPLARWDRAFCCRRTHSSLGELVHVPARQSWPQNIGIPTIERRNLSGG